MVPSRLFLASSTALLVSCTGSIDGSGNVPDPSAAAAADDRGNHPVPPAPVRTPAASTPDRGDVLRPGLSAFDCRGEGAPTPQRLRRLSHDEYLETVRALIGPSADPGIKLPDDPDREGALLNEFGNNAALLRVGGQHLDAYLMAARNLAAKLDLATFAPCAASAAGDAGACADRFISDFGRRAFRRPLTSEEVRQHRALFDRVMAAEGDVPSAVRFVAQALLGSPKLLYRTEVGRRRADGKQRLDPWETASALSYFLTGGPPDEPLMQAAEADQLQTREQRRAQAARLVREPRARAQIRRFFRAWFHLDQLETRTKSEAAYPDFTSPLRHALSEETMTFADAVMGKPGGLQALLTAPTAYVNRTLARHYGLSGTFGDTLAPVDRAPNRSGILTHGSVLALHAYQDGSSPVHRGIFVRAALLCQEIPPPPPDIPNDAVEPKDAITTRERFVAHSANPSCAVCHRFIDPIGFGLENYDGVGRYRSTDAGRPVDASGEIVGTAATDGRFVGATALAQMLGASPDVRECVGIQAFRLALGREEAFRHDPHAVRAPAAVSDACAIREALEGFQSGDFLALFAALVEGDGFVVRAAAR